MQKIAKNCSESDSRHLQPSFPGHFRIVTIVTIVTFCFFVFVMFFLKTPVKYVEASDYGITNRTHPEPTPIPSRGEGCLMCFVDGGRWMVDGGWWMENTMLCVFFRTTLTSYFIVLTFLHPPSTFHLPPSTIHLPPFTSSPPLGRGRGWALEEGAVAHTCSEPLDKGRL